MVNDEYKHSESSPDNRPAPSSRWMLPIIIALVAAAALGVGYGFHQSGVASDMATRLNQSNADAAQMRSQMDSLNSKLNDMVTAQQQQQQQQAREPEAGVPRSAKSSAIKSGRTATGASGKQIKELRAQLTDQQKQLNDTRDALDKTRTDLETSLSATRDDLNGSIARTHEELVSLAKRSDRDYAEFDLIKHAGYERSGPLSLSLRKADTKHQRFDLNLIVDDVQLSKKSVNLYEPVWIHRADDTQPVQIVVNKISKDHVHGYVSSPKYRQSELTNISYTSPGNGAAPNKSVPPPEASRPQQGAPPDSVPPNPNKPRGDDDILPNP